MNSATQDDTFLPGEGDKLKVKGTRRHWQEAGCGPSESVAMQKEHLVEHSPWCPQSLAPQMVVRKSNPNEAVRFFEIDVHDLVSGALNCYSLLTRPFPLQRFGLRFPPSGSFRGAACPGPPPRTAGEAPHSMSWPTPWAGGAGRSPLPPRPTIISSVVAQPNTYSKQE